MAHVNTHIFKHKIFFVVIALAALQFVAPASAQNITIVESQSGGHTMDTVWRHYATVLGMNPVIVPQATIEDTSLFISTTDALIISSGVISLTNNQMTAISQFIHSGKNVYLQGEYDCANYNTNTFFESFVNGNGGSFSLNGTVAGTLVPMDVLGTLGSTPYTVAPLTYFWYGCAGVAGTHVETYMTYSSQDFGFIFCPASNNTGRIIFNTDQDWVQDITSPELMENTLTLLMAPSYNCGISEGMHDVNPVKTVSIYPEPSNGNFMINLSNGAVENNVGVDVVNAVGQTVFSSQEALASGQPVAIHIPDVSPGVYFVEIKMKDELMRKKILIVR